MFCFVLKKGRLQIKYIVHHEFNDYTLAGKKEKFQRGQEFETIGNFIAYNNTAICMTTSLTAYKHFARNDDGKGLERGDLTYAIAYADRNTDKNFRFTKEEREMLINQWSKFLKPLDAVLFNYDFFNANIKELRELAKMLKIM